MGCSCSTLDEKITDMINKNRIIIANNINENNNIINTSRTEIHRHHHHHINNNNNTKIINTEGCDNDDDIEENLNSNKGDSSDIFYLERSVNSNSNIKEKIRSQSSSNNLCDKKEKIKSSNFIKKLKNKNHKNNNRNLKLLSMFIEAKIGIYSNKTEKEVYLISKGMSQNSLDNLIIESINSSIKKIKKIYKNQIPPSEDSTNYIDDLFPPNQESLLGMKNNSPVEKIASRLNKLKEDFMIEPDNIIWLRPEEIFANYGKYSIFVDDISVNDVLQGSLGNCYFMSSLAAMSSKPQLICQLFKTLVVPKNRCYQIGLNIDGEWKIVLLDDYFPCSKKNRIPIFAKPNGPELWSMLLEKAWAKLNGGYLNITGGNAGEVLRVLTSFPIESIKLKISQKDYLWQTMNESFRNGEIISACSNFNSDIEKFGLISGHSFTVTNFTEGIVNNELIRLIRLRNPWGYREWNGPWSDNSSLWTDESKKVLINDNLVIKDDGEFWMNFDDFFHYFIIMDICKTMNPQCVRTYQISNNNLYKANVFELQVFSKSNVAISVYKKSYRFHRSLKTNEELGINIILVRKSTNKNGENKLQVISSDNKTICNPLINIELTVGYYLIYVQCNYKNTTIEKQKKVRLYVSANKYFYLFYKNTDLNYNLLKNIVIHDLLNSMSTNKKDEEEEDLNVITNNRFHKSYYGYLMIQNKSEKDIYFNVSNKSENYQLFHPFYEGKQELEIILPPHKFAVFVGMRKKSYETYKFDIEIIRHSSSNFKLFDEINNLESEEKLSFLLNNCNLSPTIKTNLLKKRSSFNIKNSINNKKIHNFDLPNQELAQNFKNYILQRANKIQENSYNSIKYFCSDSDIENFLNNIIENEVTKNELDEYDFIYKQINIDKLDKIMEKIDFKSEALKFFLNKYKKEMTLILNEVSELKDDENVIFRDVYDYGDSYYIGEWKINDNLIKHGRGLLVYSNGSSYLGQFYNDKKQGKGTMTYNTGEKIDITWKNDNMDGIGYVTKIDGKKIKVFYQNGEKIC